jgi:hypothetical protein
MRWSNLLRWLGAVLGALLIAAAEVSPAQVSSNLASWARYFGSQNVPLWLVSPHADTVAKYLGVILVLIVIELSLHPIARLVHRLRRIQIDVTARVRDVEFAAGTMHAGIAWHPRLSELRIYVNNKSNVDFSDLNIVVRPDEPVTEIVQISNISNVSIELAVGSTLTPELVNRVTGQRQGVIAKLLATSEGYRIECPLLRKKQYIELLLAVGKPSGKIGFAATYPNFVVWWQASIDQKVAIEEYFDNRRPATWVQVDGTFSVAGRSQNVSMRVNAIDPVVEVLKTLPP